VFCVSKTSRRRPRWVKSVDLAARPALPFFPYEQTSSASVGMSQTCQKRSSDTGVISIRSNVMLSQMC
jgi:hypothetical protein